MELDNYPSLLKYLRDSSSSLELSHLNSGMITAEITLMQRVGGYKEPVQRVVKYRCIGDECLSNLENILSVELETENLVLSKNKMNYGKNI